MSVRLFVCLCVNLLACPGARVSTCTDANVSEFVCLLAHPLLSFVSRVGRLSFPCSCLRYVVFALHVCVFGWLVVCCCLFFLCVFDCGPGHVIV